MRLYALPYVVRLSILTSLSWQCQIRELPYLEIAVDLVYLKWVKWKPARRAAAGRASPCSCNGPAW